MSTLRAFIAIHLPPALTARLAETAARLAPSLPPRAVRWVDPERMHLTLHFLGEVAVDRLPPLYAAMDDEAARHEPFTMALDRLGCFPNPRRARVIWVGLTDPEQRAARLQAALGQLLKAGDWPHDAKAFRPHLTLGRVRSAGPAVSALPYGEAIGSMALAVEAFHLIESRLRPSGPEYTVRHTCRLGG